MLKVCIRVQNLAWLILNRSTVVWFVFVLKSHFKDVQPGLFFIRIFRVLNTVQSFIFKVHVVAILSGNV